VFLIALRPEEDREQVQGEMAEWFKAPVLTQRQEAEANSGAAAGPERVEGRMPE